MALTIACDCGYVAAGETEDELIRNAEEHIQDAHPDSVGHSSREELLAMAEES